MKITVMFKPEANIADAEYDAASYEIREESVVIVTEKRVTCIAWDIIAVMVIKRERSEANTK